MPNQMYNEHTVFWAVFCHCWITQLQSSFDSDTWSARFAPLHCRCCHFRYRQKRLTRRETVTVLGIAVSCLCVYMETKGITSALIVQMAATFYCCFCPCMWCVDVHMFLCVQLSLPTAQFCLLFDCSWPLSSAFQLFCYCCSSAAFATASLSFLLFLTEPEKANKNFLR